MEYTKNFKLKKPEGNEKAKISDINENFDEIDKALEEVKAAAQDIDLSKITKEFEPHLENKTNQLHISTVASIPTVLDNEGIMFKVDGTHPDSPSPNSIDDLAANLRTLQKETASTIEEQKIVNQTITESLDTHSADYVKHSGFAVTTYTNPTYFVTLDPAPTEYKDGMGLILKLNADQTATVAALDVNGLGAKSILNTKGSAAKNLKKDVIYSFRYSTTVSGGVGGFILQGEGGEYGTASSADVLTGKTIGTDSGLVSGTMPNMKNANLNSDFTNSIYIPKGYYDGTGVILPPPTKPGQVRIWEKASSGSTMQNTTMKEMASAPAIKRAGVYRIGFSLRGGNSSNIPVGQVYINGIAAGTQRTNTSTTGGISSFTDDLQLKVNDIVQFYGRCTDGSSYQYAYMESFYIGVTNPTYF